MTAGGPRRVKILGIVASARKQGNCALLLKEVFQRLRGGFETETVFLSDLEIKPCDGCHYCQKKGACRIQDDMAALGGLLQDADAVVLCSPTYMGGLSSRMRAFMERTWPLRKGKMAGRTGSYIVTGRRKIGVAVSAMSDYLSRLGMVTVPGVLGYAFEQGAIAEDEEAMEEARRLARDLERHLRGSVRNGDEPKANGG